MASETQGDFPGWMTDWMGQFNPTRVILLEVGLIVLVWALARITAQTVLKRLERSKFLEGPLQRLPGQVDLLMRIILLTVFALQITIGGWGRLIVIHWQLGRFILIDELLLLMPFVIIQLIKWYYFYPINRFIKEYIVAGQLEEGLSARPVWSRWQYISFQIRHNLLIILVPVFLILTFKDIVELVARKWFINGEIVEGEVPTEVLITQGIIFLGVAVIFLFSPLLLRRIWRTRPLPQGTLRERLEEFCQRIGFKYRQILLWDTFSAITNAAVMGLIRPVRYVLLSDALIENMSDEQIEAVFGHEAAHVKNHHIMFLIFFVMGAGSLAIVLLEQLAFWLGSTGSPDFYMTYGYLLDYGIGLIFLIGWLMLFGFVSRRFERQADVFAAQAVDRSESTEEAGLGNYGVVVMSSALHRIAMLNGISIHTRSWRHSSIASRIEFLAQLAKSKKEFVRFQLVVNLIKFGIIVCLCLAIFTWYKGIEALIGK